jgi:hypothetical protein
MRLVRAFSEKDINVNIYNVLLAGHKKRPPAGGPFDE